MKARELSEGVKAGEDRNPKLTRNSTSTAISLYVKEVNEMKIQCIYCNKFYFSASCESVTDPNARRSLLIKSNRSLKCLKIGHQVKNCKHPRSCRKCGGSHHQSICLPPRRQEQDEKNSPTTKEYYDSNTHAPTGSTVTATSSIKTRGNVVLQTAIAIATNEENTKSTKVCILFDSGSQRSYISDNLQSKLGLKTKCSETLHLNTFGEKSYRKQNCKVVSLQLRTRNNKCIKVSALSFPTICSPLTQRVNFSLYPHLQDLGFADNFEGTDAVDVLSEADFSWDIVGEESIRG